MKKKKVQDRDKFVGLNTRVGRKIIIRRRPKGLAVSKRTKTIKKTKHYSEGES